jgi:hypothetical protein
LDRGPFCSKAAGPSTARSRTPKSRDEEGSRSTALCSRTSLDGRRSLSHRLATLRTDQLKRHGGEPLVDLRVSPTASQRTRPLPKVWSVGLRPLRSTPPGLQTESRRRSTPFSAVLRLHWTCRDGQQAACYLAALGAQQISEEFGDPRRPPRWTATDQDDRYHPELE